MPLRPAAGLVGTSSPSLAALQPMKIDPTASPTLRRPMGTGFEQSPLQPQSSAELRILWKDDVMGAIKGGAASWHACGGVIAPARAIMPGL